MALELAAIAKKEPAAVADVEKTARSAKAKFFSFKLFSLKKGISSKDRMFFTEQLALLIETGMPVHQALVMLQGQVTNPAMALVLAEINEMLTAGSSLSHALQQHPAVFSTAYVNLVAASEGGGFMHEVLTQLLEMEEKREELRNTLVSAFTYPAFLVVFSLLVVIFVLVFVFPKFGTLFLAIKDELPVSTIVLLAVSDFLRHQWPLLLGSLAGLGFLLARWLRSAGGRRQVDRLKLGIPFVSQIFTQVYLVQSLRVLSLSLRNGVTIVDSLHACRDVVDNAMFRQLLHNVESKVTQGGKIGEG